MVDSDLLGKIFSLPAAAWVATCAWLAHLFRARNERLRDIASEKASDWQRLRDARDRAEELAVSRLAEVVACRRELAELHQENIVLLSRAVTAEATLLGLGEARQRAAELEAAKRIVAKHDPQGGA